MVDTKNLVGITELLDQRRLLTDIINNLKIMTGYAAGGLDPKCDSIRFASSYGGSVAMGTSVPFAAINQAVIAYTTELVQTELQKVNILLEEANTKLEGMSIGIQMQVEPLAGGEYNG